MQDVVPDIVIVGKPMANGHPMGAVITTSEIAASFSKDVGFFRSFDGNSVSCAIGLSFLEVIEEPNPPADGIKVALIEHNGAPIELIEFKK